MNPSGGASSPEQTSEDEQWNWVPKNSDPDVRVDIPKLSQDQAAVAAAKASTAKKQPAPLHPAVAVPLDSKRKARNMIIWGIVLTVIIVPAVVGPVYYTQVVVPRDRAAAEAAARAAIKPPVAPLPPLVPITEYFYDDFSSLSNDSWSFQLGNGLDRGWNFLGFGNNELQCFTSDPANVDVIQDPTNATNSVLRLQALYSPTAMPCTNQEPYNQTTTQWTSGRIRTKSKRLFKAPASRLPNTTTTDNCTSLFIEARMLLPAVRGNRAGLLLLPEPQNQTMGAPRCEWTDECGAYGIWPASGEIAITEHKDTNTKVTQAIQILEGGAHGWRFGEHDLAEGALSWHTYKLEWNCDFLRWYVDGERVFGVSRLEVLSWPFDQPFYLAISYAIGGRLVNPNVDQLSSSVLVDYVRAWYGNRDPPTANIVVTASAAAGNSTKIAVNGTGANATISVTASQGQNSSDNTSKTNFTTSDSSSSSSSSNSSSTSDGN